MPRPAASKWAHRSHSPRSGNRGCSAEMWGFSVALPGRGGGGGDGLGLGNSGASWQSLPQEAEDSAGPGAGGWRSAWD